MYNKILLRRNHLARPHTKCSNRNFGRHSYILCTLAVEYNVASSFAEIGEKANYLSENTCWLSVGV